MPFKSINEYGRRRANPKANTNNLIHLPACDDCSNDDLDTICQESGSKAATAGVSATGVILDGETTLFPQPVLMSNVNSGALVEAVNDVIDALETDPVFSARYEAGTLTVSHVGYLNLEAIVMSSGGNLTTAQKCVVVTECDYKITAVGEIDLNGVELENSPYAYSGTAATDATTAASLKADLESELTSQNIVVNSVTVEVNDELSAYDITVNAPSIEDNLKTQGKTYQVCNCKEAWATA